MKKTDWLRQPGWLGTTPRPLPTGELRGALVQLWGPEPAWLLGHAWDGVIWGRLTQGQLRVAAEEQSGTAPAPGAPLCRETLLDLRLFDESRELRVWRVDDRLETCLVQEAVELTTPGRPFEVQGDRDYQLLRLAEQQAGTVREPFCLLQSVSGHRHCPPTLDGPAGPQAPRTLRVRLYFERSPQGLLREFEHRLLGLGPREQQP